MTRHSMNTHTNRPIDSRTCQIRARSRYSKPCSPNQFDAAPSSTPWMPRNDPISVPNTTTASAPEQREGELALMLRLALGDHRREEDARPPRTTSPPRTARVGRARSASGCTGRSLRGRSRRSCRARRGSAVQAAPTNVWSRNSAAITKKNHAHARCAGVSATSPGARNDSVACSRPCQPRKRQRPKTPNRIPMPPSSAISDSTLQTITLAVGRLSTRGSGGQLFV